MSQWYPDPTYVKGKIPRVDIRLIVCLGIVSSLLGLTIVVLGILILVTG